MLGRLFESSTGGSLVGEQYGPAISTNSGLQGWMLRRLSDLILLDILIWSLHWPYAHCTGKLPFAAKAVLLASMCLSLIVYVGN